MVGAETGRSAPAKMPRLPGAVHHLRGFLTTDRMVLWNKTTGGMVEPQNLKDLLEIKRLARQGAAQRNSERLTRPERITKAKEIKARLAENEREHAKLCKELKLYSNHYNRREEIDWKDNDRRAAELDKLIRG